MPHTSWGAWWPPLHAVHGGEGYDGESEITDIAFLKRKRDDAKGALRARGEPLARRSRCKHREEPARVEARDILKYLRSRERGADASKPRMQCVPRSRRPTSVMSHHLHPTRVFARKKQTTTRAPLTETPNAPREMRDALQTRIPYVIKRREASISVLSRFDKCFAATWLDNDRVLFGTKDNQLAVYRVSTRECATVDLPRRSGAATTTHNLNARPGSVGLWRRHTTADEPEELSDDESSETTLTTAMENCGIHAIAVNPSGTRMVTGASNPNDAAVFTLPELLPTAMCVGHSDWVFGLDWITDNIFASGSRDSTVKIWSVPDVDPAASAARQLTEPLAALDNHRDRVRDLKYCLESKRLASVSVEGGVMFTDPETMRVAERTRIRGKRELVCVATDGKLLAAGSAEHISFFDNRVSSIVRDERLVDDNREGIRSLSFCGGGRLLTCGSGGGEITFFDARAGKFLPATRGANVLDDAPAYGACLTPPGSLETSPIASPRDEPESPRLALEMGEGWLDREHHVFVNHFSAADVLQACYAHAWDPTGTRLMVAGGPLAYGLRGCYLGVWG